MEEFWSELLEFRALFPTIKDAQLQAIEFGVGQNAYSFSSTSCTEQLKIQTVR